MDKMCPACSLSFLRGTVLALICLSLFSVISAGATNRTIDDYYGDSVTGVVPVYSEYWNVGQECGVCAVTPDASLAFRNTWHDTTAGHPNTSGNHNVTLTFTGTAVWVYCILVNNASSPDIDIYTNLTFTLDGAIAGTFIHQPISSGNPAFQYNTSVYSNTSLSNTTHTLVMTTIQGTFSSLLLFDYAVYTFEDASDGSATTSASHTSSTSSTSRSHTDSSAIAGGVLGGIAGVMILIIALIYCRRRKRHREFKAEHGSGDQRGGGSHIVPFMVQTNTLATDNDASGTVVASSTEPPSSIPVNGMQYGTKRALVTRMLEQENRTSEAQDHPEEHVQIPEGRVDLQLRREMASLREEMVRLLSTTARADEELPPAYTNVTVDSCLAESQ